MWCCVNIATRKCFWLTRSRAEHGRPSAGARPCIRRAAAAAPRLRLRLRVRSLEPTNQLAS